MTLFPDVFKSLEYSICKRAVDRGIVNLNIVNIRDFATDNYKTVDDATYGGGAGQIIKPDILGSAIDSVYNKNKPKGSIIYGGQKASGSYYNGNTLSGVNKKYATDKNWANAIFNHMKYLYGKVV